MKVLVVSHARQETRAVANALAARLDADVDVIIARDERAGVLGWLLELWDALFGRMPEITTPGRRVQDYDVVVVGSPSRNASLAGPVRTYLARHASRCFAIAIFVTSRGHGDRVLHEMSQLCGKIPLARLVVDARECGTAESALDVDAFVERVRTHVR